MAQRTSRGVTWGTGTLILGLAWLAAGCSNDNAILTGPTPAGVTVPGGQASVAGSSTTSTTAPSQGPAPAEVVVGLELKVRQAAGGCWESFAPGAPSAVVRQDLWFSSTTSCSGTGWSIALQVFGDPASLNTATKVPTTAALLRDGNVLVVAGPSTSPAVRALLARQANVSVVQQAG